MKINPGTLKHLRLKKGYSQAMFADAVGVNYLAVYKWEKEYQNPSEKNLIKICDVLNCTIEELSLEINMEFREQATDSLYALYNRSVDSEDVSANRVAVGIFSHLYPEPAKMDIKVEMTEAEEQDDDLLPEDESPESYEGD